MCLHMVACVHAFTAIAVLGILMFVLACEEDCVPSPDESCPYVLSIAHPKKFKKTFQRCHAVNKSLYRCSFNLPYPVCLSPGGSLIFNRSLLHVSPLHHTVVGLFVYMRNIHSISDDERMTVMLFFSAASWNILCKIQKYKETNITQPL